jgi:hypothetical protein
MNRNIFVQLYHKTGEFVNKNIQGKQETVILTLQPLMVSV